MATHDANQQAEDNFTFLSPHQFIVLTTYRRDGTAVPTTVWFAQEPGKLYITTSKGAGKIKRVRNQGRVLMTPSDRAGTLTGDPQVAGLAHEADTHERVQARTALHQKYGELFDRIAGPETEDRTYIVVEAADN